MKRIFLISLVIFMLTGCGNNSKSNVLNNLNKKVFDKNGYTLSGDLEVVNNDEVFNYDVKVSFKKDNYYKVVLTNKSNDHTQVILKNDDGVYVLTPALNKSFRFQSDWPYNNSQIYLLNALINDIKNDKNSDFLLKNKQFIFKTKVNYPNNNKLVNQKIIINSNYKPSKVIVYDKDGVNIMTMKFNKINYSPKFSKDEFNISNIVSDDYEEVKETTSLEDVSYPLFLPTGTKLVDENRIKKENGERVIMNFDGEKSFLLVEETADVFNEFTIIPSAGEPYFLKDTLAVMTDNSLSWESGNVDYYLVSDVMSMDEMVEIAQSIGGVIPMK